MVHYKKKKKNNNYSPHFLYNQIISLGMKFLDFNLHIKAEIKPKHVRLLLLRQKRVYEGIQL